MRVYKVRRVHSHDMRELRAARKENDTLVYDDKIIDLYKMNGLRGYDVPYRSEWTPQWVMFGGPPENPIVDFSYVRATAPLGVTQRIINTLGDVMDDVCAGVYEEDKPMTYGELLPLKGEDGNTYYLFRPPVIDALDEENSDFKVDDYGYVRGGIGYHTFHPERLKDAWLFYLKTQPSGVNYYATEQFKQRVEEHGFTNLPFNLVWDSEDPEFQDGRYTPKAWATIKRKFAERKERETRVSKGRDALAAGQDVDPEVFVNAKQEQPISDEDQQIITGMIDNAITMLNTRYQKRLRADDPPRELIQAISDAIDDLQNTRMREQAKEDRAIELGVLWAEQVCRQHGFHWARVNEGDSTSAVFHGELGIVATDRSMYVEPTPYVFGLLQKGQENTSVLLFNMLAETRQEAEPGSYTRVG